VVAAVEIVVDEDLPVAVERVAPLLQVQKRPEIRPSWLRAIMSDEERPARMPPASPARASRRR
jgi:hypothetical protein